MLHCYYLFDCSHGIITFLFFYMSILDPDCDYFLFYDSFFLLLSTRLTKYAILKKL